MQSQQNATVISQRLLTGLLLFYLSEICFQVYPLVRREGGEGEEYSYLCRKKERKWRYSTNELRDWHLRTDASFGVCNR